MALAVIVISEEEGGDIDVSATFDPPVTEDGPENTPANVAAVMIEAVDKFKKGSS